MTVVPKKVPLRIADKLARKVDSQRQRHSALVLQSGNLISQGYNQKGHHAEQDALYGLDRKYTKGATLVSFRLTPNGEIGNSRPCQECWQVIFDAGIRHVIYFNGYGWDQESL